MSNSKKTIVRRESWRDFKNVKIKLFKVTPPLNALYKLKS